MKGLLHMDLTELQREVDAMLERSDEHIWLFHLAHRVQYKEIEPQQLDFAQFVYAMRYASRSEFRHVRAMSVGERLAYRSDVQDIIHRRERCELCGFNYKLCVDHCHYTGLVRALLCRSCNIREGVGGPTLWNLEDGFLIYVDIYGSVQRDEVRQSRRMMRAMKAAMEKIA